MANALQVKISLGKKPGATSAQTGGNIAPAIFVGIQQDWLTTFQLLAFP
jgi:hypothetical protein